MEKQYNYDDEKKLETKKRNGLCTAMETMIFCWRVKDQRLGKWYMQDS